MFKRFSFIILCIALAVISAIPRFINVKWDGNNRIHPDEALIVNGALKIRFSHDLNTGFHDYNGLSVYMLRAIAKGVSAVTQNKSYVETPEGITLIGRHISAFASTITVLFVFLLISNFFPIIIAISTALVVAFAPLCIQLAHFYTTDSLLVLFFVCLILSIASYFKKQSVSTIIATAFFFEFRSCHEEYRIFFRSYSCICHSSVTAKIEEKKSLIHCCLPCVH